MFYELIRSNEEFARESKKEEHNEKSTKLL